MVLYYPVTDNEGVLSLHSEAVAAILLKSLQWGEKILVQPNGINQRFDNYLIGVQSVKK